MFSLSGRTTKNLIYIIENLNKKDIFHNFILSSGNIFHLLKISFFFNFFGIVCNSLLLKCVIEHNWARWIKESFNVLFMWFIFYISFLFKGKLCKEGNIIYLFRLIIKRIHECVYAYNICHIHKNITSERYGGSYGAASTGPENYKSLRWISGEYPPDEIRRSHQVFGQWASKYQERTNHSNVHARADIFSTFYILYCVCMLYVLRQNY